MENTLFGHEKFKAYRHALKFLEIISEALGRFPPGNASIVDQLKRASVSTMTNIAEGSGKQTVRDRRNFYSIARGSAMECAALLDVCNTMRLMDARNCIAAKAILNEIVSILTAVCSRKK